MYPSPQAVAAIRQRVADWSPADAAIVAALNAPAVANPAPQGSVPSPLSVMSLMGLLDGAGLVKLEAAGLTVTLRDDCRRGDREAIGNWAVYAALLQHISTPQRDAILGWLAASVPDPSWPAQISWAVANLGRPVDSFDVAAARPGA